MIPTHLRRRGADFEVHAGLFLQNADDRGQIGRGRIAARAEHSRDHATLSRKGERRRAPALTRTRFPDAVQHAVVHRRSGIAAGSRVQRPRVCSASLRCAPCRTAPGKRSRSGIARSPVERRRGRAIRDRLPPHVVRSCGLPAPLARETCSTVYFRRQAV